MFILQATGNLVVVKLLRLFLTQGGGAVLAMCAKGVELKLKFTQ